MHAVSDERAESSNYLTFPVDKNAPITVRTPKMQAEHQAQNEGLLGVAEILGRRTQIRISPEVWCKWRGRWRYKRLRARHVTISCPNPEQADLVLDAIARFAESLDGKSLAIPPVSGKL